VLLFGLFGWEIAALYLAMGLLIAMIAGFVIGKLNMESELEDWVQNLRKLESQLTQTKLVFAERIDKGIATVRDILGKVWLYVVIGIAIGAVIHGYVPADAMAPYLGSDWWSVPLAVLVGVPLYANAAGVIPIVDALMAKGAALGTVLAFMMATIALSLPEMIILRKILKPKLIAVFVGVVSSGILLVGYVFNVVL
ncbi:MAG TPA: permease, partial [Thiotrichales bacterium]|nr:permease [Thiotrichales bacterium]